MQVLIIEDEHRAANQLIKLLELCDFEHQLLGVIDSVEDAITYFEFKPSPDLIFMDIQLADGLSFEIFQKVDVEAPIIFTTAFDQYAIQAFKVNSIDYLLKPIQQKDLDRALEKFKRSNKTETIDTAIIAKLLNGFQTPSVREGVLVRDGNAFVQIKIENLLYIYSQDSITFGVTKEKRYIIDETMDQFFNSLDESQFFRINRGQIIAKKAVEKISPYLNHRLKISALNARDQEFIVSRSKTSDFKNWINS